MPDAIDISAATRSPARVARVVSASSSSSAGWFGSINESVTHHEVLRSAWPMAGRYAKHWARVPRATAIPPGARITTITSSDATTAAGTKETVAAGGEPGRRPRST